MIRVTEQWVLPIPEEDSGNSLPAIQMPRLSRLLRPSAANECNGVLRQQCSNSVFAGRTEFGHLVPDHVDA